MKTIFDLCQPRDEVLQGSLSEDIFAARLKDVMDGTGDAVYSDPRLFFENTYPTSGLKTLITDALGRLVGDAAGKNAIIHRLPLHHPLSTIHNPRSHHLSLNCA